MVLSAAQAPLRALARFTFGCDFALTENAKMKVKRRGFTLIEILIVIVILAVLATLVLPKFLAQPEGALLAEANHQLGALARAQNRYMAITGGTAGLNVAAATSTDWSQLGLLVPSSYAKFKYTCTTSTCTATRSGGNVNNAVATITYNDATYGIVFSNCSAGYSPATATAPNTRGCVIAA